MAKKKKKTVSYADVAKRDYGWYTDNGYDKYVKEYKPHDDFMKELSQEVAAAEKAQDFQTRSSMLANGLYESRIGAYPAGALDPKNVTGISVDGNTSIIPGIYQSDRIKYAGRSVRNNAMDRAKTKASEGKKAGLISDKEYRHIMDSLNKEDVHFEAQDRAVDKESRINREYMSNFDNRVDYENTKKYGGMDYSGLKTEAKKTSDPKEREWILSYAESIKQPEDYDEEINEKRKHLRALETEYGYDPKTGKLKTEDSFVDRKGLHERNAERKNKLAKINKAREDLADSIKQKEKRISDQKKTEYYDSLKKEKDFGIYANKDLPDGYYASDTDRSRTAVSDTAQIPIPGGNGINPVAAGRDSSNDPTADVNQNAQVMSKEEKEIFNYLYHTQGLEAAKEYLYFIQEELNRKRGEALAAKTGDSYLEALASDFAFGLEKGSIGATEALLNDILGDRPLPRTPSEYATAIHAEKYKDYGPEFLGRSAGQWGLEAAVNIGNMMPSIAVSGAMGAGAAAGSLAAKAAQIAGAGVMGIGAGANSMNEVWREGADKKSAALYGTVNGLSEATLQYYLGGIAKQGGKVSGITKDFMKDKLKHTVSRALFNIGSDMLSEGTEEYLQEVLDPMFRNAILGENNEIRFFSEDALYAGLQGAFTSLLMSGPGNIAAARSETYFNRKGRENAGKEEYYIKEAERLGLSESLKEYNNSEKTKTDFGQLVNDVDNVNETTRQFLSEIGKQYAERVDSVMEAAAYKNMDSDIEEYNNSEKSDYDLGILVRNVQSEIGNEIIHSETMEEAEKSYKELTVDAPEFVKEIADKAMAYRVKADAVEWADKVNGIENMSENTKNVMKALEEKTHMEDTEDFRNAFAYYYAYGRAGVRYDATRDSNLYGNILTQREKELANSQGLEDRNESLKRINPNRKTDGIVRVMTSDEITEDMRSEGIREIHDGEVNNDQHNAIRGYAAIHGFDVVMYGSDKVDGKNKAANGWYDPNTNTIYLNMSKKNAGKSAAMMILSHEFTHSLKHNATEQYKKLADYIIKTFQSDSSLDVLVDMEMKKYEKRGIKTTPEKAMDEVIAEACQELFKNSEEVIRLAKTDPGIANKIKNFIKEFIQSIKKVLSESEPTSLEAKHLKKLLGDLSEVQKLYDDAIKASATRDFTKSREASEKENTDNNFQNDSGIGEGIMFSHPVEEEAGLVAYHNMTIEKLDRLLDFDGLPGTSIAITREDLKHEDFGNITIIFEKRSIDPNENENNLLYERDANTPVQPNPFVDIDISKVKEVARRIHIPEKYFEKLTRKNNRKELERVLATDIKIIKAFLEQKNTKNGETNEKVFVNDIIREIVSNEWINENKTIPLTIENIVKEMEKKNPTGAGRFKYAIRGVTAKQISFQTMVERKSELKNVSRKQDTNNYHKVLKRVAEIINELDNNPVSRNEVESDIIEALRRINSKDGVLRYLEKKYQNVQKSTIDKISDLAEYIDNSTRSYFESKIMRVMSWNEIKMVIIPKNTSESVKGKLKKRGIPYIEYDANTKGDRSRVTRKYIEEYKFYSLQDDTTNREILVDALETAAQTDEERKLLKDYKSEVKQLETLEFLAGEMEKASEKADTAKERDLYLKKAYIYRKAVQNTDKELLKLEATEPLKNVLDREVKARQDEGVEALKKRYSAREEHKRMTVIRNRSKTEIAALTRMITTPTKKDYVPEVLKKTVGEFIQSIDFVSRYADPNSWNTEQWRSKMYNLASVLRNNGIDGEETKNGEGVGMDPTMFDPDLLRQIDAFIMNHEGKNISDLDSAALTDLYIITRKLRMGIRNYNRMFTNKRFESIERAGYETIEMLDDKKTRSRKRDIGIIRILDKLLTVDMLEPKSYFKRFGKAGESIYEAIAEGDDRNKSVLRDATEYVAGVYEKLGIDAKTVRKWNSKKSKQSFDVRGNNITMTPLQIMTLYELSKRDQAMRHINRGGIRIEGEDVISVNEKDPSGKQENKGEKAVTLFDDDVKMITDTLTDEQKAFADELQKWMANEGAAYGNEVSMKMYGSRNFTEPNYFPIKTDSNSRNANTNEEAGNANLYRILNLGMTKTVDETAKNAVIIRDIMSALSEHVADMALYYGYAMPIADAMKWFNYRYDIGHETKSVRGEMDRVFGSATQQYFKNLLAEINGNAALNNDSVFDKMTGAYKAAAVGGNLRVIIQQPIAYIRALSVMNPKYLAKAIKSKNNIEEMEKYAPIAWWKDSSFRENGMGKSLKSTLTNDMTLTEKWTDFLTKPAGWADKVTWGRLWNAVKYEVKDKYGDMEYEDFMEKCAKRFRQVVDETQVVDTKLSRSQLMRNQNGLTKLATAFMMEPTKTYNMLYDAYTSKDAKKIARATAVWALENIVLIAVKSAYDSFRRLNWSDDEKEKDYLQRFLDSAKTNAADEFIPLNMIPFLKEIPGAVETIFSDNDNTRTQRFDMQWLYDLADAVKKTKKYYSGDRNEKDRVKTLESILKSVSNVSGVPVSNLWREAKTITNSVLYQFMGRDTVPEQIRRAAQYKYDGEFDKYKEERKKILEERYISGEKKVTPDEFIKMVDSEFTKIKKAAEGENADTEDTDEFEQDKAMYKIGDAKKAVSDGNYHYVQEILDEIYSSGHPVTEEQKKDYFDSKAKSFKSSLGKLLYKDPEDKDGDGKISDEEKADKVLADDYEKKKKEYLKLKIDGKPLFDEDYFFDKEKKDRKSGLDAALDAAGKSADTGASAQSIQSIINEIYDAEKPDNRKAEINYMKKKKPSIKADLTTYYKVQKDAGVRARLKVIYKKLYLSGSKIKLYEKKDLEKIENDI